VVALARFICILGDHNTSPPDYKSPQTFQSLSTSFTILHSSLSLSLLPPLPPHFLFFYFFFKYPPPQRGSRHPHQAKWRASQAVASGVAAPRKNFKRGVGKLQCLVCIIRSSTHMQIQSPRVCHHEGFLQPSSIHPSEGSITANASCRDRGKSYQLPE